MKIVVGVLLITAVLDVALAVAMDNRWDDRAEPCVEAAYLCAESVSYFESFERRQPSDEDTGPFHW